MLLPRHDADIDCEDTEGNEAVAHHWDLRSHAFGGLQGIQAFGNAVYLIGTDTPLEFDDSTNELQNLEWDALAILAAVKQYRMWQAQADA